METEFPCSLITIVLNQKHEVLQKRNNFSIIIKVTSNFPWPVRICIHVGEYVPYVLFIFL